MKIHELKCWPRYFIDTSLGLKNFELRKNDRDFHINDILVLYEWNNETSLYTGRYLLARIDYILEDTPCNFGLVEGYCIMKITLMELKEV